MTHVEFITSLTRRVRLVGAAAALDELRANRPSIVTPSGTAADSETGYHEAGYHETLAVFYVWAVDRLVAADLTDVQVLWHPLTDVRSPRSWWDDHTLATLEAQESFVPSTLARAGEPTPMVDQRVLTAA